MVSPLVKICVFLTFSAQFLEVSSQDSNIVSNASNIDHNGIFEELVGDNGNANVGNSDGSSQGLSDSIEGTTAQDEGSSSVESSENEENLQHLFILLSSATSWLKSYLKESYDKKPNPSACERDTNRLIDSALAKQKWTIPFLDSSGKPGPSFTKGWSFFVGNLDQCEDAEAPPVFVTENNKSHQQNPAFKGQYCNFQLYFVSEPKLHPKLGICVPDSCSDSELYLHAFQIIQQYKMDNDVILISVECIKNETEVTAATVIAILLLVVVGSLVIAGTTYDLVFVEKPDDLKKKGVDPLNLGSKSIESTVLDFKTKSTSYDTITSSQNGDNNHDTDPTHNVCTIHPLVSKILLAFSAYSNGKKILSTSEGPGSIGALHGLRYFSIAWVVLVHFYMGIRYAINAPTELSKYYHRISFNPVSNGTFVVDTFFAMSGMLTSYLLLNQMKKKNTWKINWAMFYFHRFWRLTPPYMVVIILTLGLTQYFGSGPMWANQQPYDKQSCQDSWWKNLLYINNFGNLDETCISQSWYIANDMQFYVISPLMIVPIFIHPTIGLACSGAILLALWITTGVLSSENDWVIVPFAKDVTISEVSDWNDDFYIKPWNRIGPYIVGILAGFLLTKTKGKSLKVKWYIIAAGWILSTVTALAIIYGPYGDVSGDIPSSTEISALYNAVARSAWGVVICWIVIACDAGYGGPVNAFLSWKPFVFLGRLTYMIYLIHYDLISIFYQNMGQPFYMNNTMMASCAVAIFVMSSCLAFLLMLLFESPMVGLEIIFIGKGKRNT